MVHAPLNNINGSLVNVDSSNYSGSAFTSRVIPSSVNSSVMPVPRSNIQAANSYIPCNKGGGKIWNKIKKISMKYKMPKRKASSKRKMSRMKKRVKSILKKRGSKKTNKRYRKNKSNTKKRVRFQKGGWAQYQNNLPMTNSYSTGGVLAANQSALANPAPFQVLSNCTNCIDNYSRYTNSGFPSKGSY